jgi:site-specific DNA recombinase
MTRVALYLRQSLDTEGKGLAIARQEKACREYVAKREGWTITEVFSENSTSASGRRVRKEFDRMIEAAKRGEFDVIVALHLDRLTRTLKDYLPLLELAEKHGVGVTTVSGELDLTTDMGQTLAGVLAVFASGEIKRKGRRQVLANEQRAEQGRPSQGGRRAFGWETGGMVPVAAEAEWIVKCYAALLGGASLSAIARDLNAAGVVTVNGGQFTHTRVRDVLTKAKHAGLLVHTGVDRGQAAWPATVPEATYRAAMAILSDPARRTNHHGGERRLLMTGVGRCGVCDDGTTVIGGSKGKNLPVYRCAKAHHLHRAMEPVDEFVQTLVIERLSRDDAVELLVDRHAPDLVALDAERAELVARQNAYAADAAIPGPGAPTPAMLRAINAPIEARIAVIDGLMSHQNRERVLGELIRSANPVPIWAGYSLQRRQAVLGELGSWTINKGKPGGNQRDRYATPADYRIEFTPRVD